MDPEPYIQSVVSHDDRKFGSVRLSTPSTVCDESDDSFQEDSLALSETTMPHLFDSRQIEESASIAVHRSFDFAKGPFIFPKISRSEHSSRPICIICRNELRGGEICQELRTCGHCFHGSCFQGFVESHSRCPVCRVRFQPSKTSSKGDKRKSAGRPYWSPDYDIQLLSISDKFDRDRRMKKYLLKGKRDNVPKSYVFLKSGLPTLVEESPEGLEADDGTLVSLCKCIARESEIQKIRNIRAWSKDMKRLAITFMFSVICLYIDQTIFADLFIKKIHQMNAKNINRFSTLKVTGNK